MQAPSFGKQGPILGRLGSWAGLWSHGLKRMRTDEGHQLESADQFRRETSLVGILMNALSHSLEIWS